MLDFLPIAVLAKPSGLQTYHLPSIESYIVNGIKVAEGEIPFAASLRYIENEFHFCGASILDRDWLITAAHCLANQTSINGIIVGVGSTELSKVTDYRIKGWIIHEKYNDNTLSHDIALIKLSKSMEFGDRVQPVELPQKVKEDVGNGDLIAAGWGRTHYEVPGGSPHLLKTTLRQFDLNECRNIYGQGPTSTVFCAFAPDTRTCRGDSGGPVFKMLSGKPQLVGIVSWGPEECVHAENPSGYTHVARFLPWIASHIK